MRKPKFYWHIHHHILVEPLTEPLKNRIAFIERNKLEHERETRLRLMQPVKGKLPDAVVKARKAWDKARKAYVKAREAWDGAREACNKAWAAYLKALRDHKDEIEALHTKECPNCPWDGETIFPREE